MSATKAIYKQPSNQGPGRTMRHALLPLLVAALLLGAASPALASDEGPRSPTGQEKQETQGGSGKSGTSEDSTASDSSSASTPPENPTREESAQGRKSGEISGATNDPTPADATGAPTPAAAPTADPAESTERDEGDGKGRGRGKGDDKRADPAPVGAFALEQVNQKATGEYVAFTYNDTGVQDFTAGGVTLFNLTVTSDAEGKGRAGDSRIRAQGAQMRLDVNGFRFTAHDAPTAVARAEVSGKAVLDFAEGVTVTPTENGRARFVAGNVSGTVKGHGLVVTGSSVSVDDGLLLFLDTPRGAFDVHRQDIGAAISKGHVGAEATFSQEEDAVKQDVVSYNNVTMTTVKAERGNLTLLVEGHGLEGRVLVLNVDGRMLGAASADQLTILLDNLTIERASNLTDILDPDDDGYQPEYYIVHDPIAAPDAYQLIVTVPHYSVHTLSVTTAFVLPPPSVVMGIVAGLIVLVPSAFVLFRRK